MQKLIIRNEWNSNQRSVTNSKNLLCLFNWISIISVVDIDLGLDLHERDFLRDFGILQVQSILNYVCVWLVAQRIFCCTPEQCTFDFLTLSYLFVSLSIFAADNQKCHCYHNPSYLCV